MLNFEPTGHDLEHLTKIEMANEVKEVKKIINPEKLMDVAIEKTKEVKEGLSKTKLECVHFEDEVR